METELRTARTLIGFRLDFTTNLQAGTSSFFNLARSSSAIFTELILNSSNFVKFRVISSNLCQVLVNLKTQSFVFSRQSSSSAKNDMSSSNSKLWLKPHHFFPGHTFDETLQTPFFF